MSKSDYYNLVKQQFDERNISYSGGDVVVAEPSYIQSGVSAYDRVVESTLKNLNTQIREREKNKTSYINNFINNVNRFFSAVDSDINGSKGFNAADYFEERQNQANNLKRYASVVSQYLEQYGDSFTPESYDYLREYLANFDTQIDDVMGYYQPAISAKQGMQAYQDEYSAYLEQQELNGQKWNIAADISAASDSLYAQPISGFFDLIGSIAGTPQNRGITDQWTDEQRYILGTLQNEDPAEAQKYARDVNRGQDPFQIAAAIEQEEKELLALDLTAAQRELDELNAQYDNYEYDASTYQGRMAAEPDLRRMEQEIDRKQQIINRAKLIQDRQRLGAVGGNDDFAAMSGFQEGITDPVYQYVNDVAGARAFMDRAHNPAIKDAYDQMTEEEISNYNYHYATGGSEQAQRYLDTIAETLNQRKADKMYESVKGQTAKELLFGAGAGLNQAAEGFRNLFSSDDYIAPSAYQIAGGKVREDLEDKGWTLPEWMGGASLGQVGYDLINTAANMAPSMAIGALNPIAGTLSMGASAAGNAYQEALNEGYSKEQARTYSALVGASEAGLEYLLGGISSLGGVVPGGIVEKMLDGVDNAFKRFAIEMGGSMIGEGFEEGLQEVLTPYFQNLVLNTDKDVNWNEVAYSALLGALSGGVMEAPGNAINAATYSLRNRPGTGSSSSASAPSTPALTEKDIKAKVAEDGKSRIISTGENVGVNDFHSIKGGEATILLENGNSAPMDDVNFASTEEAARFMTIKSLPGIETEAANDLYHAMKDNNAGSDTDTIVGVRDAYALGYYGFQKSDATKNGTDAAKLSPALRTAAFEAGQKQRSMNAAVAPKVSTPSTAVKPAAGYKRVVFEGKPKLDKKTRAEVRFMDFVAEKFSGTTVHVYQSFKGNGGKYYYRDSHGKIVEAPNGRYVNDEIWIDLNSGDKGEGLALNTFAHEMYHHVEKWNKKGAQKLAEFVVKELGMTDVKSAVNEQIKKAEAAGYGVEHFMKYGNNGKGMTREQAINAVEQRAMSDFVADSLETMFSRGDAAETITRLKEEDRGLFDKIKEFIDQWVSTLKQWYSDKTISEEGKKVAQLERFEELQKLFLEAVTEAGTNYNAALGAVVEANAEAVDANEIHTDGAFVTDGEGTMYSIRSMKSDIAEGKMFEDLMTYCNWTQNQVDTLRNQLNDLVEYMTPFRDIMDLNETYDRKGRRFSPYKPNSDPLYKISMDFSTLCSKRLLTQYVIENLQLRENRPMSAEEQMAIRDMLNEYRKQEKGLQVACAMCYVEAARLKSPKQMQKWMDDPETYMRNYFADKDPDFAAYIKGKQEDFKESRGYARNTPKKGMKSKDRTELDKIRPRLRAEYQPSSGEMAIIEKAKKLPNSTYLTAANLANLSESDPTIYAAYTSFVRTATRSKSLETDEPYYYGDSRRDNGNGIVVTDDFIEEVNRENGMRFSSWSDWRIQHMLDYITAVIDNAVRGAAMHGYTKFPEEVRVLGKTGMMFNMSGVAGTQSGLNPDGSLSFSETESIDVNEAIQLREEFPDTAGLQCIGVGDAHIVELLKSDIIDYVIPYHTSGLNKALRTMANIHGWKDYQQKQHAAIDKDAKLENAVDKEHWHEEPVFSEFFVGYNTGMSGIEAMKASAENYKRMCAERGMKPKFEQFAKEPNYWKLLIDRKMINQKTGDLIQQKPVTPTFDFDAIKAVVDRHVKNYDSNMDARALNHIVENWDSIPKRIKDLKKSKKPVKKSVDTLSNETLAAQPAEDVGMFSLRENVETSKDLTAFHNITKVLLEDVLKRNGLLMPSLAVTNKGMTDFGEISLLFDSRTIDPNVDRENKLYGADAWTPTQTQLKKNAKFDVTKTVRTVNGFRNRIGSRYADKILNINAKQFMDTIKAADGSIYDAYAHNIGIQTAYAIEKGIISKIPTKNGAVDMDSLRSILNTELDTDNGWRQYKRWLNSISDSIITSYDNATNDDILKNMKSQPASAKMFKLSANGELVVPAVEYSSIEDLRKNKHRLSDNAAEATKAVADEFMALAARIGDKKTVVEAINSAFPNRYSVGDIIKTFKGHGVSITEKTAREVQSLYRKAIELPTQYFEAKPHREIGLDEIKAVVIPDSATHTDLKQKLQNMGIRVIAYKADSKQSRLDALNSVQDVQFSLRNTPENIHDVRRRIASGMDDAANTGNLKKWAGEYREKIAQAETIESNLKIKNRQIRELSETKNPNRAKLYTLKKEANQMRDELGKLNKRIQYIESLKAFRDVSARENTSYGKSLLQQMQNQQAENIQQQLLENRIVREELTGKDSDITIMEKEFIRIVKKYEQLDAKTGKKITDLRNALKAEAKSHRDDSAAWERRFNQLMRDYEASGRKIERLESTIARQRATAKERVQSRRNTELRHKIQRKANELNNLLLHGTKHRNIPEYLQPAVAGILDAINMEVRDIYQRTETFEQTMARYTKKINMATDANEVRRLLEKRDAYAKKALRFEKEMDNLKKAYEKIKESTDTNFGMDDGLYSHLMTLFVTVGDTPLGQMTQAQLEAVNDVLNITKETVSNANKLFHENQRMGVEETSKAVMSEVRSVGGETKKRLSVLKNLSEFGWLNLKPIHAFEMIGSEKLTNLFKNVRKGEDTFAKDLNEAKEFFRNQWNRQNGKDWDREKQYTFKSSTGKSFSLTLDQIMSLYALSKREQARDHLRTGGFAFDSSYKTQEELKVLGIPIKVGMESTDASAYNLTDEILGEIIGTLSTDQRAFVDAMQAYLSDNMAAKGNEVSLKKYGIKLFKDQNYFPLRIADQYMAKKREEPGDRKLKNAGFTQATTPKANNPVVLSGFMDVWGEHVDEMSLYHSFVLPLDDLERVLNYHDRFAEGADSQSVVEAIRNAYGTGASKYIDQLIKDINGGARTDGVAKFINQGFSKAKKAQTLASLSVAIQQPSAIIRAGAMIDSKYFFGPRVTEKTQERTWEEIKRYAPIARIKEMGGFDVNVGKSTVEYLTDTSDYVGWDKISGFLKDGKYRDDVLGRIPAWVDELGWGVIWNAVKREIADKHPGLDWGSNAYMKMVADRFTDVIVHTQVYDSVFSRNGMMRSTDTGVKMATAFMAEPATTANMLAAAIVKAKRGGKGSREQLIKTVSAITGSLIINSALSAIVYAMRDDDEDESMDEKWLEHFHDNLFESLNPASYIPILRDIVSMTRGFDVERTDMALYGDLLNAINGLNDDNRTAWEKVETVVGAVGNFLGIPLKNIIREGKGVFNTIARHLDNETGTSTGRHIAATRQNLSDGEQLLLAIQRGDEEHITRVAERFDSQEKSEGALVSAIGSHYRDGSMTAEEARNILVDTLGMEEDDVYWKFQEWDFRSENGTAENYSKFKDLYNAIESGESESEIDRYLEHGTDNSDIRSAITRKYKKAYIAADESERETIRETITPAFQNTGMDEDDIQNRFRDWDFEAEYGMSYSEFKGGYLDDTISESALRDAMRFYGRKNYQIEADIRSMNEEKRFRSRFGMSLSEMKDAYDSGDISRNKLISALEFTGLTNAEARQEVSQRDISNRLGIDYMELDDAYKHGDISRTTFYNSMIDSGATREEADEAIAGYDWLKKHIRSHPDLTISDGKKFAVSLGSNAEGYTLEDYGVSIDAYKTYKKRLPECKGVDANGDGEIDSGTKRDEIFAMINSLPISDEAKTGLALMSYSMNSIKKNAPWY